MLICAHATAELSQQHKSVVLVRHCVRLHQVSCANVLPILMIFVYQVQYIGG